MQFSFRRLMAGLAVCGCGLLLNEPLVCAANEGRLLFSSLPKARYHFDGFVGERIDRNVEQWLLRAPEANPGMVEMFRLRDREPKPELVPWAGEFVGKYLISAIQALRMVDRPDLRGRVQETLDALISTQAEDGYLGPFRREVRLTGNWDLWGHYHCMLALLMWHDETGAAAALRACRRAADLICATFLDSNRRVFDAGSPEMNMAVVHSLGWLYRLTREPRYWQMMEAIEKDWERAGDYLRAGVAGLEFFETPRPRWESLHDLQGLLEFYRITGEDKYQTAFAHHWRSILRWDRRNTGGFSSGEQATGNPYAATAIETCCTVAWMALSVDMLRLSGDARAADELELSFYNAALGAQHPSGRWCTYNTPMDGAREASAHTIVFQSRAGTPELNCCSVNGPRALGLLSEWAVMTNRDGLVVNYYGPGSFEGVLADGTPLRLRWITDYPRSGKVLLSVDPSAAREFSLSLRVPAWSAHTSVELNDRALPEPGAGRYLVARRRWEPGDRLLLTFDLRLRAVPGARDVAKRVSICRGPLLLAYDQAWNEDDENRIPAIDLKNLPAARETTAMRASGPGMAAPFVLMDVPTSDHRPLRLCDFATAGARGTRYRSWLSATPALPSPAVTRIPRDGAVIPLGDTLFRWTGPSRTNEDLVEYELRIGNDAAGTQPALVVAGIHSNLLLVASETLRPLAPRHPYYWQVIARNAQGSAESVGSGARFEINPDLAPAAARLPVPSGTLLLSDPLGGRVEASSVRIAPDGVTPASGPADAPATAVETDGIKGMVVYQLQDFPEEDYSASLWLKVNRLEPGRLGQVCSAWSAPMDDPLRLCFEHGKLYARIEAGQGYSTGGAAIEPGQWTHVAFVKTGTRLLLYVNGRVQGEATVPLFVTTAARDIGLGGNPHYPGGEFLPAQFARFELIARALGSDEVRTLASRR